MISSKIQIGLVLVSFLVATEAPSSPSFDLQPSKTEQCTDKLRISLQVGGLKIKTVKKTDATSAAPAANSPEAPASPPAITSPSASSTPAGSPTNPATATGTGGTPAGPSNTVPPSSTTKNSSPTAESPSPAQQPSASGGASASVGQSPSGHKDAPLSAPSAVPQQVSRLAVGLIKEALGQVNSLLGQML